MSTTKRILAVLLAVALAAGGYFLSSFIYPEYWTKHTREDRVKIQEPEIELEIVGKEEVETAPQEEPAEEPAAVPAEEPNAEPVGEPAAEPVETPVEAPAEEPVEEPAEEPAAEPAEEPAAEPAEEPAAEPAEEPAAEPAEEPAAEPAEAPLDNSFFDDAVFVGDSTSAVLEYYAMNVEALGDADFLIREELSLHDMVYNGMTVYYNGQGLPLADALAAGRYAKVYIMLGALMDLGNYGVDDTLDAWDVLLRTIREKNPNIRIFIESALPIRDNLPRLSNSTIDEYNEALKKFAEENDCVFVEIGEHFKSANGFLDPGVSRDYGHLIIDAAGTWMELLKDPANYSVSPRR